jgi:hypothetical protein
MARVKLSPLLSEVSGSIGSSTFQRSLGGVMLRNKPIRKPKGSVLQNQTASYVAQVISGWKNLTAAQRIEWNQFAEYIPHFMKFNKSRRLNGYNLFCKYNLLRLQSGLTILSTVTFLDPDSLVISPEIYTVDENFFVAVGQGTNTIAYSSDGINWTGIGIAIFSTAGYGVAWNGEMFVAVGTGTNTIAYSSDGINWTGVGVAIFSTAGYGVAWNGSVFVAVGQGTNTIAYSSDGINWTGVGDAIFSTAGRSIAWNGNMFVATGAGTNTIAYSSDGVNWSGLGDTTFSTAGRGIAWNGNMFVAAGSGTNTLAYSYDGVNWIGLGTSIFSTAGISVCFNGRIFVATGSGGNTIAHSSDGINWTGLGTSIFSIIGQGVAWNGKRFVATGQGGNSIAYSSDGVNWTGLGTAIFTTSGFFVASLSVPSLVPVILHPIIFDFNENLDDEDQWALLKLSNSRQETENFKSNTTRVIVIPVSSAESFEVQEQLYNLFGTNPFSDDILNCEIQLFSQLTGKVFPMVSPRLTITAT